ncbi:MAG TPA: glycosyltransferase [Polyangiaceae bacterium]|jgi:GT2 family glycosyltransferase|nr:glycosyltransferase [Polyangiaceae bacterium]
MTLPAFSVIVPTYRRPEKLARCLASLLRQTYPPSRFEVIVVDDAAMGRELEPLVSATRPYACELVSQAHRGPAAARNAGARAARGRLLAFTDDDCEPAADWLDVLEQKMSAADQPLLVGGRVVNALAADPFASASQALVDFLCEKQNRELGCARLLTSNNLCVPTDAFLELGGFDTTFAGAGGEDRELCWRWGAAGHRAAFAPEAVVYHAHDMTLREFVRQHHAYGRGAALLRRRADAHGYGPLPLERLSFYFDLLAYPLRGAAVTARVRTSLLFALSQVANAAGYCDERVRGSRGFSG